MDARGKRHLELEQFDIDDFEVPDDSPMTEVVGKLRAVEGAPGMKARMRLATFSVCGATIGTATEMAVVVFDTSFLVPLLDPRVKGIG